ncbi:MAG TPA: hypothetical protein VFS63_04430 [Pseudolabrys sp.]|jgi:hypothetical protein|nr:hypothetical protein [Pseudolabrys sp.]
MAETQYKPTSAGSEPKAAGGGLRGDDRQQDSLTDRRSGAQDNVTPPSPEPMKEHRTPHENAQPGADVRPITEPPDENLPEGLRREPKHPINPTQGRGGVPEHVPGPKGD